MRRLLTATVALTLLAGCGSDPEPELLPVPPAPTAQPSGSATPAEEKPSSRATVDKTPGGKTPGGKTPGEKTPTERTTEATRTPEKTRTTAGSVLPANLVGDWETVTPNGNAFSYTFLANGKYVYFGLMQDGDLRYQLTEGGRAAITGDEITFKPQLVEMVRTESGVNSTTNPQRGTHSLTFTLNGNRLTFTDTDGSGSVYQRA